MPLFQVTFMNHIVETYVIEADDGDSAWTTEPEVVEELEPERWDCTLCEVTDVQAVTGMSVEAYHTDLEARRARAMEQFVADLDARDIR